MVTQSSERKVDVWDLPTRLFHWSLLALVLIAWFTGEEEGTAALIHRTAGEAIAGLIVFRVIWGFAGGERARFADFAAGPAAIIAHVRDLFSQQPKRHLGHNSLGGVAVFLLLAIVTGTVVTVSSAVAMIMQDRSPDFGDWSCLSSTKLCSACFRALSSFTCLAS